eukprot:TRINITY_DN4983_c0_g4_i3.p1 TRINITY_DN4983_c0_g4~~TRINITY_DN4983_c0_g4_i3.p1  ORF type:complete len:461 (-),score=53.64 TRINITY_DN4983_c0_g4_i3:259-1509(-)
MKFWGDHEDAPPIFNVDGVTYLHVKEGGVVFVATSKENVMSSLVLELLKRLAGMIKDFLGYLNEDSVRKNPMLVYEVLDECIDYGIPQNTSSEVTKQYILNEPVTTVIDQRRSADPKRGPVQIQKSVLQIDRTDRRHNDEIFVDVIESVVARFNAQNTTISMVVAGDVRVRSYLGGNPPIKVGINKELIIQKQQGRGDMGYGGVAEGVVILDDATFHQSVNPDEFERNRVLEMTPPDGEFTLMSYRTTHVSHPPFWVYTILEDQSTDVTRKAFLHVKVVCGIPMERHASNVDVQIPLPRSVQRVFCTLQRNQGTGKGVQQRWSWKEKDSLLVWNLGKMQGAQEVVLKASITYNKQTKMFASEVGPVNLCFSIPQYSLTGLSVKYLTIMKSEKNYTPQRWVRYICNSSSYQTRAGSR